MRKRKKEPLAVTSFRLPIDVNDFLAAEAEKAQRTKSWVLVEVLRKWMYYLSTQAKQPKVK